MSINCACTTSQTLCNMAVVVTTLLGHWLRTRCRDLVVYRQAPISPGLRDSLGAHLLLQPAS